MAIVNGYCTRAQLTAELDSSGSATMDNTRIDLLAYQASRIIDDWTNKQFYPTIETRYFTPKYRQWFAVDDLLSVTTLKMDTTGDRTYDTTWATTDYDLEPYNAIDFNLPYRKIQITPQSTKAISYFRKSVEIAGKWGVFEVTETSDSLLDGAIGDTTTTTFAVDDGTDFSVGHILKMSNEYLRVDAISTNNLTVVRGINGSTATTHSDNASIEVLVFPNITAATLRLATRMWHLRIAPLGIATAGVQGLTGTTTGTRWIQQDTDLQTWLAPYMTGRMM